ncbi:MAG: multidrug efflux SMR transporter [archaeon]|nr:multidrug efflux SMR transporter [archaeon]
MNPWVFVVVGGFFEMLWATTMNYSDGFTDPFWTVVTFLISLVSVYFLNIGMKSGLPVGACYAVWTGCGTVLSTISGILVFGQVLGALEVLFLAILIGGIILLQYFDGKEKSE